MSDRESHTEASAGPDRSLEGTEREPELDSKAKPETEPGTEAETGITDPADPADPDIPDWDDEYVDRVSDRLMHNYDLEKDRTVAGEQFTLYGRMNLVSQKHFLHPAISLAEHESNEHLFVRRVDRLDDRTLDRYVDLGHELADSDEWLEPDEEHFCTEFTFVAIAPSIPDDVRRRVADFSDRNLLKYGYHGHYEINLVVVAPDDEELVANENADVETAFRLWEDIDRKEPGILGLIARRLQL